MTKLIECPVNGSFSAKLASSMAPCSEREPEVEGIRSQFPALMENPNLLFFDNAATAQKPRTVIDAITTFYREDCANAGRASYSRATRLTRLIEQSREVVARFIHAIPSDVAFTHGATDSLNLVAMNWGLNNLEDGDEVMVCMEDHQSAVLPWVNLQRLLQRQGKSIKLVPFAIHPSGTYDRKSITEGLSSRTRLIALTHVHHLFGMEMDLPELRQMIPAEVLISLDASQSVGHMDVNVKDLGVHFISFSGHKMFAANGVGVLWVEPQIRAQMWPVRVGAKSAMRSTPTGVDLDHSSLPGMIECGTLNIPALLSLKPAVEFIESLGFEYIDSHLSVLTHALYRELKEIPGVEFAPGIGVCGCTRGYGILSFRLREIDSVDLASYLDSEGIFVRTGDHCLASSTNDEFARVSLHVYNTLDEVHRFAEVLRDATS